MSATLSPAIANSFYYAYSKGVEQYQLFNEKSIKAPMVGLFSNHYEASVIVKGISNNFSDYYRKFIDTVVTSLNKELPKHRCEVLENKSATSNSLDFTAILQACFQLHLANNTLVHNVHLSIGFVRWNTVKSCQKFANWLYDQAQPESFQYALICYHARFTLLDRYCIEDFLDNILKRKPAINLALFSSKEVNKVIGQAKKLNKKHVLLIVVTNPIQETGRDHDYDWTILEPCSTRSIIQSLGRVRRHRDLYLLESNFNAFLMRYPARYFANKDNIWSYPGIATPLSGKLTFAAKKLFNSANDYLLIQHLENAGVKKIPQEDGKMEYIYSSDDAFNLKKLKIRVNAELCLTNPEDYLDSPMTALEYVQLDYLLNNRNNISLLYFIENIGAQLNRRHAELNRFRKLNDIENSYYSSEISAKGYEHWRALVKDDLVNGITKRKIKNTDYALLQHQPLQAFQNLSDKLGLNAEDYQAHKILCQIDIPLWLREQLHSKGLTYDSLLGLASDE